jgi:hypothetical protein
VDRFGAFALFALFLPERARGNWDLLAASPSLNPDDISCYEMVYEILGKHLSKEEFRQISRLVLLEASDPELRDFCEKYHGMVMPIHLRDFFFKSIRVRIGYILAASVEASLGGMHVRKKRRRVSDTGAP